MKASEGVLSQIFKSIGIYKKKFFIFLLLFVAGTISFIFLVHPKLTAQNNVENYDTSTVNITIQRNGTVLRDGKPVKGLLSAEKNYDFFHYKILNEPGYYLPYFQIKVELPAAVDQDKLSPRVYLIQSFDSETTITYPDEKSVLFTATALAPSSVLTIELKIPKGVIGFSIGKRMGAALIEISGAVWLILGFTLPAITLLILLLMVYKRSRLEKLTMPTQMTEQPPSKLPAAVVGVLPTGLIGSREIAAILIDLAQRGLIEIVHHGNSFVFFKTGAYTANSQQLETFETILLSKIFQPKSLKTTSEDIQQRIGHHIFSRKIAQAYWEIYKVATDRGYFQQNPATIHFRYKMLGIIIFFVGFLGFILGVGLGPEPKFLIFPFAGMVFASLIIVKISSKMPLRTSLGVKALENWLAFKNYLSMDKPIVYSPDLERIYLKYLPYAIVLGCEVEWTKRFTDFPFAAPSWFTTQTQLYHLNDFAQNIFTLIGFVAQSLALSHEPSVD
ncbi:MAG: hypothetical protein COU44_02595 [Candidatus Nealsonbacteria bacterium CG10_big_fil_rev_8_21_14_0_10_40_24]|nr:MAG: hypothetical protein COU44_02595 [Candidatus Nealsonbacteria bacterium CG10_big_fil_rev_8_21_14_0_10_40_24]